MNEHIHRFDGIEGASPEEIRRIQELESGKGKYHVCLLSAVYGNSLFTYTATSHSGWEKTVEEMIQALSTKPVSSVWPRDTLFKYLQLMENLQV